MIVIWGTTLKRRRRGRVADFCPICRRISAIRLIRVGAAGHLYYLSFGAGRLVGHELCCESCGVTLETDAARYASVSKSELDDVEALVETTFPGVREAEGERLAMETRLQAGKLTPEERAGLLLEPFHLLNGALEEQRTSPRMSPVGRIVGYSTAGLFALFMALIPLEGMDDGNFGVLTKTAGILFGLGMLVTFYFLATRMGSFIKRETRPRLMRALAPLQPTEEELEATLRHCKDLGLWIGKKFKAARLHAALREAEQLAALRA